MSKQTSTTRTPCTALAGDAAQLVAAIERLHDGGFDVAELTVGKATIKLHRAGPAGERDAERPGIGGIHEQFGGELFREAMAEQLPGVDLQPAIGRRPG